MIKNTQHSLPQKKGKNEEDIRYQILKYLRYWGWFALGIFVALVLAFLYNRYTTRVYETTAEIKILQEEGTGLDLSGLEGAGSFLGMEDVNLENEIEVLKSRRLLDSVVKSLALNTRYYKVGDIKTSEIWKGEVPFFVKWKKVDSSLTDNFPTFSIKFMTPTKFVLGAEDLEIAKKGKLNTPIRFLDHRFMVTLNPAYTGELTNIEIGSYLFKHVSDAEAVDDLNKKLMIEIVGKESDILRIIFKGTNIHKNEAIVDSLISRFKQDGVRDKRLISKRTEEFVTDRLNLLHKELEEVESGLVNYKQSHNFVTIESATQQLLAKESSSEQQRFKYQTQRELAKSFKQELLNGKEYSLLPANLGIESKAINQLTSKYNEAVLMRNDRLTSATLKNPVVQQLEIKLEQLRRNILKSVNGYIGSLTLSLENFRNREQRSSSRLNRMAGKSKGIRGIMRQREIKEKLYLFLLQKREEAALQYATTAPGIKVVDYAYTDPDPIVPKTSLTYLAAIFIGTLIPFGFLYTRFLFDTKIDSKDDVKQLIPGVPVLAEIPMLSKKTDKLIAHNDRSVLAEVFRILRTNLAFLNLKKIGNGTAKVVFVTSSVKGEGKTFVALNMAHTFAAMGKKTLLIGCDLRNPQTHKYYKKDKNETGVSTYLEDKSVKAEDLIHTGDDYFADMDFIIAGEIPPDPVERLLNGRFEELLNEVKNHYDYIIVDTAPTIVVTDTLLISEYADATLYIIRSNHTDYRLSEHIKELVDSGQLKNVGVVLNGLSQKSKYGYGYNYGYGYGYSEDTSPWWKF